ncbi:MAG TPA: hypothetical protein VLH14_01020 [Patescibacteria group bacterium]|nr:hypothetical protein [Patescibacteria group bacterium]
MKKVLLSAIFSVTMLLAPLFASSTASALSFKQFTLVSDPSTAVVDLTHVTMPPLPGQPVTIRETLKDTSGHLAGTGAIDCTVAGFTTTDLLLDCQATFTLADGTITGHAIFLTSQHDYPALVISATGAYQGAVGVVRILDRAPGDETYMFNLLLP